VRPHGARKAWLSITPEPEIELPKALAALRAGGHPSAEQVAREAARAELLITRRGRRAWRRYLADALVLTRSSEDPAVAEARSIVEDVVHNHSQLELGL
jgi:hypothetical protein